jgi:hypothetical protein
MNPTDHTAAKAAILAKLGHLSDDEILPLPEQPALYFKLDDPRTQLIPLLALSPIRAREDGIRHALLLMYAATIGLPEKEILGKRDPISLAPIGDGRFKVIDGNSTFHIAKLSAWHEIPAIIFDHPRTETK